MKEGSGEAGGQSSSIAGRCFIRLFQRATICCSVAVCAAPVVSEEFAPDSASIRDRVGDCVMKARRKIIVYIATSADGYIARPDGDVEWLNRRPRTVDYGMRAFYPTIDTILWGRKTYDWLLDYYKKKGSKGGMFDKKLANYVFSRKPPKRAAPGGEFVSEPVKAFAHRLRTTPGKHIWMMGGGELIASFLDPGAIDQFA